MAIPVRWHVGLVAVLALAGCTGKPSVTPSPGVVLSVPSGPPASSASPTAQAVAAYLNLLHAFVAASNSGSTDTRDLARYATGRAFDLLAGGLSENKSRGVKTQGQPGVEAPRVVKAVPAGNPTLVDVTGCVDGTHWLLYKYDGQLADDTPSGRRATNAEIRTVGGTWKVTLLAIRGVGTCTG